MNRPVWLRSASLLVIAMLSAPLAAQGPVARVSGTVKDDNGKPIDGATITATNPNQAPSMLTARTDKRGRFGMLGLRRGTWVFSIAAPGYQTIQTRGDVLTQTQNPPLNVRLSRSVAPLTSPTSSLTGAEIQALLDTAEAAVTAGNVDVAVAKYRELLIRIPSLTSAYLRIATLLEGRGDTAGALAAYRELLKIEPDNAKAAAAVARLTGAV